MFEAHSFAAFVLVSLTLAVVPGPAVIYISTRSATQGRLAGLVSVAGIATGGLVHVIAATLGLSLLLARSAAAVQYVRIAGAAYLIYLGIQKLRDAAALEEAPPESTALHRDLGKIYRDGVVVNVLNPKAALFFLSFLPQFVDVGRGSVSMQIFTLGITFVIVALMSDSAYALAASTIASAAKSRLAMSRRAGAYAAAAIYIGLGAAAALSGRKAK